MANYECARCHRFFERVAFEEVCPACYPIEELEFKNIKEYLAAHPGATSSELVSELNVSIKAIKRYLKEERLEIIGDNKGFIRCELCGAPLNSGRFCGNCYKEGLALRRKEAGFNLDGSHYKSYDSRSSSYNTSYKKGLKYSDKKEKKG